MKWNSIESAPKDGTQILVEVSKGVFNVVSFLDGGWREPANFLRLKDDPELWHPLPTPAGE